MSKVISAKQFLYSVDDLIAMFNALLQARIDHELEFRKKVIDKGDPEHFNMIGGSVISIWMNVNKGLVSKEIEKAFKDEITNSDWNIVEYKWQEDERTSLDQIYICVKPA